MRCSLQKIVVILFIISIHSQLSSQQITGKKENNISIGKNVLTDESVIAERLIFDKKISNTFIDTLDETLFLHLRKTTKNDKYYKPKGIVLMYDPELDKVIWSKDVNFNTTSFAYYNQTVIQNKLKKSTCIDPKSGKELWEIKKSIAYTFPYAGVAMGYKTKGKQKKIALTGIDLSNGKEIWNREIDRSYGWREIRNLNDSTILVSASGLHAINYKTGRGWSYKEKVGKERYNFWWGNNNIHNICSNIIVDSTAIYFASSNTISSYTLAGEENWSLPLSEKHTSKSTIFTHEDDLVLLNLGMANSTARPKMPYGTPYLSRYDKATGELLFKTVIPLDKDYVRSSSIVGNILYLLFKERMVSINIVTGERLTTKSPGQKLKKKILYALSHRVFYRADNSTFTPLHEMDTTLTYYMSEGEIIVGLNKHLEIKKILEWKDAFVMNISKDKFRFLCKKNKTFLIDENNNVICQMEAGFSGTIFRNKLYTIYKNYLQIIDLSQQSMLMKETP